MMRLMTFSSKFLVMPIAASLASSDSCERQVPCFQCSLSLVAAYKKQYIRDSSSVSKLGTRSLPSKGLAMNWGVPVIPPRSSMSSSLRAV